MSEHLKCGTRDTAAGLIVMFGVIAFVLLCAVQGWNPVHAAMALLLAPLVLMAPLALAMWICALLFGRRG